MEISIWISIGSLAISIISLIYAFKSSISKVKINISEKRNSIKLKTLDSTLELLMLLETIRNEVKSEQGSRIVDNLIQSARGMTDIHKMLGKELNMPFYLSSSKFLSEYDRILSDMMEFDRLLKHTKSLFDADKIDELEDAVNGLHSRVYGSGNK